MQQLDRPITIVHVDDDEATRYAVCRMLRHAGFEVQEAATGAEGLLLAETNPDLMILDVHLPDIDGYEVCRRLRQNPRTASLRIIHLSASFVDTPSRVLGLECGADSYLAQPVEPHELIATVRAMLRIREAEQARAESEERLQMALESGGMVVWEWDIEQDRIHSDRAGELLGLDEAAISRSSADFLELVHPDDREDVATRLQESLTSGSRFRAEFRVPRGDGSVIWILEEGRLVQDSRGSPLRMIGVARDVTERKVLEEALLRADRVKDEFLAMLSHELRSPLAPIRNAVQVLRKFPTEDPGVGYAREVLDRQIGSLARLVDDILDISRIKSGKISVRKAPVRIAEAAAAAVELVRPQIDARRHALVLEPGEDLWVMGDLTRLTQVIGNLLSNAAKYTGEGGRIGLRVERSGQEVLIRVSDTGIGIPRAMLDGVFSLFAQLDHTADRSEGGLGVGLALVRTLVDLHGGSVAAFSEGPGRGSEFVVTLPLAAEPASEAPRPAPAPPARKTARRILVVDDNADAAQTLGLLLRMDGHEVVIAESGAAAIEEARRARPDVILLDIGLPDVSGYEVARRIRRDPALARATLVALTGYGREEDQRLGEEAGFDHYLVKPVDIGALEAILGEQARCEEE